MSKPIITVVGSINMDLVVTASRRPAAGETIHGHHFETVPGGKGANQAVAAARLGATVNMIGRVGDDAFGQNLQQNLEREHIFLKGVEPVSDEPSGVAVITLAEQDNSIVVVAGANAHVTPEYVYKHRALIAQSDIVLTQLEVPLHAVEETARLCEHYAVPCVLNPAPARSLSRSLLSKVKYVTPNSIEFQQITDGLADDEGMNTELEKHESLETVLNDWTNQLIVTAGKDGVIFHDGDRIRCVPAYPVQSVDTTGAGDTFNGALAYAVASGEDLYSACRFANAAAALSIEQKGAQTGMPTLDEVNRMLAVSEKAESI